MNIICSCGSPVEQERIEILNSKICSCCARKVEKNWQKPKAVMCYGHKTAAEIQILTPTQFAEHRRYNPYGRYTGRGSGLHRVTRSTSSI